MPRNINNNYRNSEGGDEILVLQTVLVLAWIIISLSTERLQKYGEVTSVIGHMSSVIGHVG